MSPEVKASPRHGLGLFARALIPKGSVAALWNKRELSEEEAKALPESEHKYLDMQDGRIFLMGKPARYVNHACEPNTKPGDGCDLAFRDIQAGEEITTDYAAFFIPGGSFRCQCGSLHCRGIILGKNA